MNRNNFFSIFLLTFFTGTVFYCDPGFGQPLPVQINQQASLKEDQILYNGRLWHNLYQEIKGDQFLFSNGYLPGSLTINCKSYNNLGIRYDIYNDEIITLTNHGSNLQLNKEMVDSFSLVYNLKTYRFKNSMEDSLPGIKGYIYVLYKGKSALYVKYKKEIQPLAVDNKYDLFKQTYRIYFVKAGTVNQINSKNELLKVLYEDKAQIKDFIKKNKLKISKYEPESFIPVIRYYDSLSL
ncbi:MAG TPA: hypothetical protein VF346_04660 [Bacteroidales bacterium]